MTATRIANVGAQESTAIRELRESLFGELVLPGDERYDEARQIHNPSIDRRPAMIVRAADSIDVTRAIEFARSAGMQVAIRSGGHCLSGHSMIDDGMNIDLSGMKQVNVDQENRTAWVQPGATTADLVAAIEPYGLALTTGDTATVGIGGLTLGGGIGWLVRKYGLTIDSLLSVEMVTAHGRLVTASKKENPDLFWALRGGGGNFGIVTGFEFQLQQVGQVFGGVLILPATREVLSGYALYAPNAPDELTTITMVMHLPPLPFVPEDYHGKLAFVIFVCYVGDPDAGQVAMTPLRKLAAPIAEILGPMPYSALYNFTEIGAVPHDSTIRSGYLHELSGDVIDILLEHATQNPMPMGLIQIRALGGAFADVPCDATAFAHRDKKFLLALINIGTGEAVERWVIDLWERVGPSTEGAYVNFLDDEGEARVREAYSPEHVARLAAIKRQYDPENVFNSNQNILPAEA